MKKKTGLRSLPKKKLIAVAVVVIVVIAIGIIAMNFLRMRGRSMPAMAGASGVQSAEVTTGNITTTVTGTGNLEWMTAEDIQIPAGVEVTEVLVESGNQVKKGDVLARLDEISLTGALLEAQAEIEELDEEIQEAMEDEASSYITAGLTGTVEKIYASVGDKISDVMADEGALIIISADDGEDTEIAVTGAVGTVSDIYVEEGDTVSSGENLIYLEDVPETAEYISLVSERKSLASYLQKLSEAAKTNSITAAFDGVIQNVNISEDGTTSTAARSNDMADASNSEPSVTVAAVYANETAAVGTTAVNKATVGKKPAAVQTVAMKTTSMVRNTALKTTAATEPQSESEKESEKTSESETDQQQISITSVKNLVTVPAVGQIPQDKIEETNYYTGTIEWNTTDAVFAAGMVYTATVTLETKSGEGYQYIFPQNIEIVQDGADVVTTSVNNTKLKYEIKFAKTTAVTGGGTTPQQTEGNQQNNGRTSAGNQNNNSQSNANSENQNNSKNNNQGNSNSTNQNNGQPSGNSSEQTMKNSGSVSVSGSSGGGGSASTSSSGTASSADSSSAGSDSNMITAFTIAPNNTMQLSVNVDELDILQIEEGQSAAITFDALEDETYTGTITQISDSASVNGGVAKYTVSIEIPKDENMRVGMNASAAITVEDKQNILLIPAAALQERGNSVFVYTTREEDGTLSGEVEIETGLSDGTSVEVVSGLSEGDTVYYTRVGNSNGNSGFDGMRGMGGMGDMPNMSGERSFQGGRSGGSGMTGGNMQPPSR